MLVVFFLYINLKFHLKTILQNINDKIKLIFTKTYIWLGFLFVLSKIKIQFSKRNIP